MSPIAVFVLMENWNVFTITAALADPLRLNIIMYLVRSPASVSEVMHHTGASQSNLSNHLLILRKAGLITSTSAGRQKIYRLANQQVAQLVELLLNMQQLSPQKQQAIKPIQFARTCYDHLAGKVGVALFNKLVELGAVRFVVNNTPDEQPLTREMEPGANAGAVFKKLGVDLAAVKQLRRHFAFGCTDWTERAPHLAGALGAALCQAFFDQEWIARHDKTRTIILTTKGKNALKQLIGLDIASPKC